MIGRISVAFLSLIVAIIVAGSGSAFAQQQQLGDNCGPYSSAIEPRGGVVSVVPDSLLNNSLALQCLLRIIKDLQPSSNGQLDPVNLNRFVSGTSAIRILMTSADRKDKDDPQGSGTNLISFIQQFHRYDSLKLIEALAYGLRQDTFEARSNSLAILGNVIDNRFACVLFDQLYDPQIDERTRANLLAVVSVIAPWAYAENFENICRWLENVGSKIDSKSLPQTASIIANLTQRLNTQTDRTNQSVNLPEGATACYQYKPRNAAVVYQRRHLYGPNCKK